MPSPDQDAITTALIRAASEAGELLMTAFGDTHAYHQKESLRDISSALDIAAEAAIISVLSAEVPGVPVIAEEKHRDTLGDNADFICVDGLDGSVNFIHGQPEWSVSIGWVENGEPTLGVVFSPASKEIFYGGLSRGAFRNQERVKVTDHRLESSLLAASFSGVSPEPEARTAEYMAFGRLNDLSQGVIRSGSGALNLARMASGQLDGVWGRNARIWDVFAGLALVRAAGGRVSISDVNWDLLTVDYAAGGSGNFADLSTLAFPDGFDAAST